MQQQLFTMNENLLRIEQRDANYFCYYYYSKSTARQGPQTDAAALALMGLTSYSIVGVVT